MLALVTAEQQNSLACARAMIACTMCSPGIRRWLLPRLTMLDGGLSKLRRVRDKMLRDHAAGTLVMTCQQAITRVCACFASRIGGAAPAAAQRSYYIVIELSNKIQIGRRASAARRVSRVYCVNS